MSAATRATGPVPTDLTTEEMRYLRKCVRYELGLRKRPGAGQIGVSYNRAKELREFAKTFTEED